MHHWVQVCLLYLNSSMFQHTVVPNQNQILQIDHRPTEGDVYELTHFLKVLLDERPSLCIAYLEEQATTNMN